MNSRPIVHRFADGAAVANAAADAFVARILELLTTQSVVHVQITGGTVGIATLAAIAGHGDLAKIDFNRVHIWWGDERYVAADSQDRNCGQADRALLGKINLPIANRHEFPSTDSGLSLDEAAIEFGEHFAESNPIFDFALVGMGPDGHICSLFPERDAPATGVKVFAEHNSPKPPAQRLTFSYEVMNAVKEIWFVVAGADKSSAVAKAFSEEGESLPVGRVSGTEKTVWFIDATAASQTFGC